MKKKNKIGNIFICIGEIFLNCLHYYTHYHNAFDAWRNCRILWS